MWTIDTFRPIYQEFLDSGKTVRQFSADAHIPQSRFFYWQTRLRKEVAASQSGEFMPVSINNRGGKVVLMDKRQALPHQDASQPQPLCEICFPNGVTVRLSGNIPLETISRLVMLQR